MDAVIRQAVRDELRHQNQTQNVESIAETSSNPRNECTERCFTRLLDQIRKPNGEKRRRGGGFISTVNQWYLFQYVRERAVEIVISYNVLEP